MTQDEHPGFEPGRRDLLVAPLLAAMSGLVLSGQNAAAASSGIKVDPAQTFILPPDKIVFKPPHHAPPQSVEVAELYGKSSEPGLYMVLTRWYPGWMSAPHYYESDRVCYVVSGTWWVMSGDMFDPEATVPVPPGGFVRRVARTVHYDGVKAGEKEPVTIAICGIGPITRNIVDPSKPDTRRV